MLLRLLPVFLLFSGPGLAQQVDILNPPRELLQLAWRLPDGRVQLQYTYTAPNSCWSVGDTSLATPAGRQAVFTAVPQLSSGFCMTVLTPIDYSRVLALGFQYETLKVVIEHPEGGLIEQSELLILHAEDAPG